MTVENGSTGTRLPVRRHMLSQDIPWSARLRVLFIWLISVALAISILVLRLPLAGQVQLVEGDVAPNDVVAPGQATYVSDILTKQRRDLASSAVPEVYDPPQARVGRQQLNQLNRFLDFIGSVRADSYADTPTKTAALKAIVALSLPADVISRTLMLPNPAWDRVAAETQVVLERAMREEIRENGLADERRKIPARVRLDFSDDDVAVVSAIVEDLLVPNSFLNAERTEQRRQQARDRVEPVTTSIERNEIILREGDIVSALDLEALERLGLRQASWSWVEALGTAAFIVLLGIILLYYLWRIEPQLWLRRAEPLILAAVGLAFLGFARLAIPSHTLLPYVFPYAALPLILALLINSRVALVAGSLLVVVAGWLAAGDMAIIVYAFAGSLVGTLKLQHGERLASFAVTAGYIVLVNLAVVLVFALAGQQTDLRGLAELAAAAIVNGILTITVTLLGIYVLGQLFGVITPLQLIELSRPTHPLLRHLLLKAPGTYHHTLIVSNMAESAAEAIGADTLLARVGTYYHDVGKTIRPYFFIENRTEGADPHARLDPRTSAQIIISHVKDGIVLARKYRLPQRVIDFIPEHHGTLMVAYFYHQAVRQAGSSDTVDKRDFRYPGPKPQNRETAISMLADGAEATVRSKHPGSVEEIEQIVSESIQSRVVSGQLDECSLTLDDLTEIRRAFVDVLRGLHHPRVAYPVEATRPAATDSAGEDASQAANNATRPPREVRRATTTSRESGASRAV